MFELFGLNFNPFDSAHGGEKDAEGNLTARGKKDFFASAYDFSDSIQNWKDFLHGDISWRDFVDPGSVINNPAQKIADPGEFFTGNKLTEGDFGKRGRASAAVAALIYAGIGAPGLSNLFGAGAGGGSGAGAGESGNVASLAGDAGSGGASQLSPISESSFSWSSLFNNDTFQQLLGGQGGGGQQQQQQSAQPVISRGTSNFSALSENLAKKKLRSIRTESELDKIKTINPFI